MTYSYKGKSTINKEPMKAVLFTRVSSREQERGDSIDAQMKTVKDYCIEKTFQYLQNIDLQNLHHMDKEKSFMK